MQELVRCKIKTRITRVKHAILILFSHNFSLYKAPTHPCELVQNPSNGNVMLLQCF